MLGVGAQTVLAVSYAVGRRTNTLEKREETLGPAAMRILLFGLVCIVLSGLAITYIHIATGQSVVVHTPAYLYKWILIGIVGVLALVMWRHPLTHFMWEGVASAHWYAIFILHVVAPLTTWTDLLVVYVLFVLGFMLMWYAVIHLVARPVSVQALPLKSTPAVKPPPPVLPKPAEKPKLVAAPVPAPVVHRTPPPPPPPKPVVVPPPPPKPIPPVIPVPHKPTPPPPPPVPQKPILPVPQKPIEDPDAHPGLPAIRVMPTTPQDVDRQMRAGSVQFDQQ